MLHAWGLGAILSAKRKKKVPNFWDLLSPRCALFWLAPGCEKLVKHYARLAGQFEGFAYQRNVILHYP